MDLAGSLPSKQKMFPTSRETTFTVGDGCQLVCRVFNHKKDIGSSKNIIRLNRGPISLLSSERPFNFYFYSRLGQLRNYCLT